MGASTRTSRMPAGRTAMAINLVPAVALVTGWAMLGDSLAPAQMLACVVIFGGVVLGQMPSPATGPSATVLVRGLPER
jgi:drug/metabolite transporter (DMT)-like permease